MPYTISAEWCSMGNNFRISPYACIGGALLLMVVPAQWWLGAVLAALFHEISHFAAIYLTGGRVIGISIGVVGAKMEIMPMSRGREALCALAGPVGSLLLALGFSFFPEIALCALVQGLYNLIPVYPLDGGRILRCLLPSSVCAGIEVFAIILLMGSGIWCCFSFELGILPMIPGLTAAICSVKRKIPCKESRIAVQ